MDLGLGLEVISLLQLRNLSVGLGEEPYIGFIQENSMEDKVADPPLTEKTFFSYIVVTPSSPAAGTSLQVIFD